MPRKAKDTTNVDEKKVVKKEVSSKKTSAKKVATKSAEEKASTKKVPIKSTEEKASTKKETSKEPKVAKTKSIAPTKKTSTKKIDSTDKKVSSKATKSVASTKKASSTTSTKKKSSTSSTKKASTSKKIEVIEYYDLPYRYNQTVVKILAQTPTTLFVYWDVSDEDKKVYIKQYGEYFYNNTKPVLIVHNITKNYSFEIDINDYANSWYLKVDDSKCDYKIELGRRGINKYVSIPNNYLYISSSNELEIPNDHILFENMSEKVCFKNVKTGQVTSKDISSISFLKKIGKLYNIQEFYEKLYTNKNFTFEEFNLKNPSSGNPTSTFK